MPSDWLGGADLAPDGYRSDVRAFVAPLLAEHGEVEPGDAFSVAAITIRNGKIVEMDFLERLAVPQGDGCRRAAFTVAHSTAQM